MKDKKGFNTDKADFYLDCGEILLNGVKEFIKLLKKKEKK